MDLHNELTDSTFNFSSNAESLVTIKPDGTVVIHKDGADKQAAKAFWGSMGDELKNIEKTLIWERDQWKDKYEELKTAISAIADAMMRPPPSTPSIVLPGMNPSPSMPPTAPPQDLSKLMREGAPLNLQASAPNIIFDPSKINTGFYKEADGTTHIVFKGKKLF